MNTVDMCPNEQQRLWELIRGIGGFKPTARVIRHVTGVPVHSVELWRAANTGRLTPKLRRALLPPPPRYRVAIDCDSREEQRRLAELLRGDDGRRMPAAELIGMLED